MPFRSHDPSTIKFLEAVLDEICAELQTTRSALMASEDAAETTRFRLAAALMAGVAEAGRDPAELKAFDLSRVDGE
ncbi:MAG TPA: hypothetical protein VG248_00175 [Caulobacteraceae bacterium]|nr:hypothetical protein [Caulobacteraceae bacterium]